MTTLTKAKPIEGTRAKVAQGRFMRLLMALRPRRRSTLRVGELSRHLLRDVGLLDRPDLGRGYRPRSR